MIRASKLFFGAFGLLLAGSVLVFAQPTEDAPNSSLGLLRESFAALSAETGVNVEYEMSVLGKEGEEIYRTEGTLYRSGASQHFRIGPRIVLHTPVLQIVVNQTERTIWYSQNPTETPALPLVEKDLDWESIISQSKIVIDREDLMRLNFDMGSGYVSAIDIDINPRAGRLSRIVYHYQQDIGGSAQRSEVEFRWRDAHKIPPEALDPEHYVTFNGSRGEPAESFATYEVMEIGHDSASSLR